MFHLLLLLLLLWPLPAGGEWILNPDQSSDHPIAVMTPEEQVIVFTNVTTGPAFYTPWVFSYNLVNLAPEIIYSHFYTDSIQVFGAPVQVRIGSDRCYVLTLQSYPERHWEIYAIDFNGVTLWHNVMTSESDPDYTEVMHEYGMVASDAGIIMLWDDFAGESDWTGRWYSPEGELVRELGPYPNPGWETVFALASQGDHFVLCHWNSATIIGQQQDSILTADIGHWMVGSHQVGDDIFLLEHEYSEYILFRRVNLLTFETVWTDTLAYGSDAEWCNSVYWSSHSFVYNSWEKCYYQRFDQEGLVGLPNHFYSSLGNDQHVVPFGDDGADWIMQRDSLSGLDCEIFVGNADSVVWLDTAGMHSNRPFFLLPDQERLHLIWQQSDGIHLKLLPDELEAVSPVPLPQRAALRLFPNPFNSNCRIQLQLHHSSRVRVRVHDLLGREVAAWSAWLPAGRQLYNWQPERLAAGTYFITLQQSGQPPQFGRATYIP